jgi:hypothetical protein
LHARNAVQRGGKGKCAACDHPQLASIDADLVAEVPYRQLAKRYGISATSLLRHKKAHLGREVVALSVVSPLRDTPGTALSRVEDLYDGLRGIWEVARKDKQTGAMLAVSRELRAAIELLAKLTGELNERPQQLTVNLLANDQFMEALKVISDVLTPYPEAKQALVARLRALKKAA